MNEEAGLKIVSSRVTEDGDYLVAIPHPCGRVVEILIPIDIDPWFGEGSQSPFGLNLVTEGHYT